MAIIGSTDAARGDEAGENRHGTEIGMPLERALASDLIMPPIKSQTTLLSNARPASLAF